MTIQNLTEATEAQSCHADVCIIGAGFAGLLCADTLAKRGFRVVILESGGDVGAELNQVEQDGFRFSRAVDGRARGFGGTSSLWSGRILPMESETFEARPHLGLAGWPIRQRDLDPYLSQIENVFRLDRQSYEQDVGALLDVEKVFQTAEDGADFQWRWPKWPTFARRNLAHVFTDRLRHSDAIAAWLDATVCGHDLDRQSGRLRAVTARSPAGLPVRVEADHFIYAAGTIETTRLLLLLDREAEGRAFETCDALGASFQDHLDAEVGTLIPADVARTHRHFSYHYLGSSRRSLHLVMSPRCQEEEGVAAAYASILIDFDIAPHFQSIKSLGRCLQSNDLSVRHLTGVAATAPHLLWRLASWRLFRGRLFLPPEIGQKLHIWAEGFRRLRTGSPCRTGSTGSVCRWHGSHGHRIRRTSGHYRRRGPAFLTIGGTRGLLAFVTSTGPTRTRRA